MPVFARTLVRKGGSLAVTIPNKLVEELGLQEGEQLVFIHKENKNYILIGGGAVIINLDDNVKQWFGGEVAAFRSGKLDKNIVEQMLRKLAEEERAEVGDKSNNP